MDPLDLEINILSVEEKQLVVKLAEYGPDVVLDANELALLTDLPLKLRTYFSHRGQVAEIASALQVASVIPKAIEAFARLAEVELLKEKRAKELETAEIKLKNKAIEEKEVQTKAIWGQNGIVIILITQIATILTTLISAYFAFSG